MQGSVELRPLILWGLDPAARSLAKSFHDRLERERVRYGPVHLFAPEGEPAPAFRRYLAELIEAIQKAGGRSARPDVTLLSFGCTWDPEPAAGIDLLAKLAGVMGDVLPGSQSIRLALFLPSVLATDDEKVRSFQYLVETEKRPGAVPFLNTIFVNQVGAGSARAPSGDPKVSFDEALFASLCLQLVDREMDRIVRTRGHAVLDAEVRLDGRRCCFSGVATYRVVSSMKQGAGHMEARFALQLFNALLGLPLDDSCRKKVEEVASGLANRFSQSAIAYPVELSLFGIQDGAIPADLAAAGFEKTLLQGLDSARIEHGHVLAATVDSTRRALLDTLERGPTGLGEGLVLLGNLRGLLPAVEKLVCGDPLAGAAERLYVLHRATLVAGQAHPPRLLHESHARWFERTCPPPGSVTDGPFLALFSDLFRILFAFTERDPDSPLPETESLVGALFAAHKRWLETVSREAASEELHPGRLRRAIRSLSGSGKRVRPAGSLAGPRALFLDVLRTAVPLYATRANFCFRFRREVEAASGELASFIEGVRGLLERRLTANPPPGSGETAVEAMILTPERLETIEARFAGSKPLLDHLRETLQTETLKSHFQKGPSSLAVEFDRRAAGVLAPAIDLSVLDVLEIGPKAVSYTL